MSLRARGIGRLKEISYWSMEAHSHPFHEVVFILQGGMDISLPTQNIHAATGDVLFYPTGIAHEEAATQPHPLETLFLAFDSSQSFPTVPPVTFDTDGRLRLIANWLYQDRDLPEPLATQSSGTLLQMLLVEFGRLNSKMEHGLVVRTRQFIRSRIDQSLTLDDLAAHAGMSKYHFARCYRELSGRSPAHDVRMIRVEFARNLLLTSNLPLKTIAPMAGLGDVYHLSRMFRKYLNLTPREMRSH